MISDGLMVGSTVGTEDGSVEGIDDGSVEGINDGAEVYGDGAKVDSREGRTEGLVEVGLLVGLADG